MTPLTIDLIKNPEMYAIRSGDWLTRQSSPGGHGLDNKKTRTKKKYYTPRSHGLDGRYSLNLDSKYIINF